MERKNTRDNRKMTVSQRKFRENSHCIRHSSPDEGYPVVLELYFSSMRVLKKYI